MSNLSYRQEKIQAKRKTTPWRDFVMEIGSRAPMMFYKNKGYISRFPLSDRIKNIIPYKEFDDYGGDFTGFGIDYEKDFLKSLKMLYIDMVFTPMFTYGGSENSDYVDWTLGAKNCYLSSTIINSIENALYSFSVKENCSNVMNSGIVRNNSNNVFNSSLVINSYEVFYSQHILDCSDIWFSTNLIGCHHCIACHNMQNQSYCINNISYDKEQYLLEKQRYFHTNSIYDNLKSYAYETNIECTDCENIMFGYQLSNCRNCALVGGQFPNSFMFDCMNAGGSNTGENRNYYGVLGGGNGSDNIYSCIAFLNSSNLYYSINLTNCSFCLGCIGLKNKSYCILNKQYTKEERYTKVDEIFTQMEKDGQLGEFFPATMNPFYFNDTAAYLIDNSFTKEEVMAKGYLWRDEPIKVDIPEGAKVVKIQELDQYEGFVIAKKGNEGSNRSGSIEWIATATPRNDVQWYIDPEILKVIIQDDQGNVYKIVKMEYDFLMKYGLPLPRKHRLDRMKDNFKIQ